MVRNLSFHCRGRGLSPWLGTKISEGNQKKQELDVCGRGGDEGLLYC